MNQVEAVFTINRVSPKFTIILMVPAVLGLDFRIGSQRTFTYYSSFAIFNGYGE